MTEEGFEPSPPKRLVPETSALDRSAIQPMLLQLWTSPVVAHDMDVQKMDVQKLRRPGIKPGSRPWQGRILSLYYRRGSIFVLGFEPRISRVLGERHNQARPYEQVWNGVSGFRSQYLVLAKHARFRLRQYPMVVDTWGIRTPAGRAHSLSRRAP